MHRKLRVAMLVTMVASTLLSPMAALAGSKGKRNTAIGLGAVAAYGIVKKKPLIAGLAGGGAIYSYMQSRKDRRKERDRDRRASQRRAQRRAADRWRQDRGRRVGWSRGRGNPHR